METNRRIFPFTVRDPAVGEMSHHPTGRKPLETTESLPRQGVSHLPHVLRQKCIGGVK